MKTGQIIEPLVYLVIIILAAAILALVAVSPKEFLDTSVVYQGF